MKVTREQFNELRTLPMFKGKVITGSMVPVINIGDEIVIEIGSTKLSRFDIVVIYHDEKLICHYLWSMNKIVRPILLQTRSMPGSFDLPIALDDYLGKVVNFKLTWWQKLRILCK